jgi:O-antigen ligase
VTVHSTLTGPLPKAGVVVLALLAAGALLAPRPRARAGAMLGALVLAPILLIADIWHSPQLGTFHRHPLYAAIAGALAVAVVVAIALVILRRPPLIALMAMVALPFRVPIQAGGATSNLLVPLYFVVACGSIAAVIGGWRGIDWYTGTRAEELDTGRSRALSAGWLERMLALYVVVYALQSVYSADFEKALQQMVFFYVPFSLLFCLLRQIRWTPRLLRACLGVIVGLAVIFALIGFVEYATKTLLLNPKLIAANDVHAYFTVNSVFFDPDIFGRFLSLVMITLTGVLLYGKRGREVGGSTLLLAVLWAALVLTLSRSSLGALLVGLGTLAALRWKAWPVLACAGAVIAIGVAALAVSPKTFGLNQGLNGASSGRAGLVSGGGELFSARPIYGWGSGSFVKEYRAHHPGTATTLSASHTIPITIAAEQGLIGELVYIALVVVAVFVLLRGARGSPARAAIAAAFLALVFHTMLYADFLEDPVTWTLLGIGGALAVGARAQARAAERELRRRRVAIAPA